MRTTSIRLLFAATAFVAAALVFLVQPMVAKQLLPVFGGTPGVWNATVTFFQAALLAGYAIAHLSLRLLGVRRQLVLQLALAGAAFAFLPFALDAGAAPPDGIAPALWIGVLLAGSVGVPYLAVTTASPVLQRWYAAIGQPDSGEPWFLYAASNAGSLVGLLAFPFVLEPRLDTEQQQASWLVVFVAYLGGLAACAVLVRRRLPASSALVQAATARRDVLVERIGILRAVRWVVVAALPVTLMLGVTTFVTTDVASAPFLWVVPLALYLLSFVVTFGRRWRIPPRLAGIGAGASAALVLLVEVDRLDVDELGRIGAHLVATFLASVLAHAVLYRDRPAATQLTGFYLLLSLGGALGGAFTSLVAPVAFDAVHEHPLLLAAALFLRPATRWSPSRPLPRAALLVGELTLATMLVVALAGPATRELQLGQQFASDGWTVLAVVGIALLLLRRAGIALLVAVLFVLLTFGSAEDALLSDRNFFGTLRVERSGTLTRMLHGTTLHGAQLVADDDARVPTTYYARSGPLGDAFRVLQEDEPFVEVGAVGLGTGTVLGHARLWQRFSFYEIDPLVIDAAQDPDLFTWVSDANVAVRIVEGDARRSLVAERRRFDMLVLDAYSSDAVPTHLLTTEAMGLFARRIAPGGVMLLHVSSRHLELEPVVAANVERLGFAAITRDHEPTPLEEVDEGATGSQWIAIAPEDDALDPLAAVEGWRPLVAADAADAWTDDFSDIASAIRWLPDWVA